MSVQFRPIKQSLRVKAKAHATRAHGKQINRPQNPPRGWVRLQKPKMPQFHEPRSIAEVWGNQAPDGEMTILRIRWAKWERRKAIQRDKAAKQRAA